MGGQGPQPEPGEDDALVARSQRGEVAAFNLLVARYQDIAYALAYRMLGDAEVAADVTQDGFLSAFRAIRTFRGGPFRAWLLRIISNGCHDYWRAQKRRPTLSLDALTSAEPDGEPPHAPVGLLAASAAWDPEAAALRGELIALIQHALLGLPPEQRLAVVLSDVQGFAYDEIAAIMATSLGTVKSRIARGRAHLRDTLRAHAELLPAAMRRTDDVE
ncbi:MAG TPA: sigma-70 family RNA polymerase sigma factor [Ktedonobacterales bacterium]|nr:sigma-70 family RNA polymerase sigma factor [Ktedonobacterales bacterium]